MMDVCRCDTQGLSTGASVFTSEIMITHSYIDCVAGPYDTGNECFFLFFQFSDSFRTCGRQVTFTYFVTQCAAVRTHCVPISAPPHRYWLREFINATCQHHSLASASSPPTTRAILSEFRAWIGPREVPFTPQTYLLYTGLLVVVIIVVVSSKKLMIF